MNTPGMTRPRASKNKITTEGLRRSDRSSYFLCSNEERTLLCFQGKKFCGRNFRENKGMAVAFFTNQIMTEHWF